MSNIWQRDVEFLAACDMFATEPVTRECPYCGEPFKPRYHNPTPDQTFGHWQRFCSQTCLKLWREDLRETVA